MNIPLTDTASYIQNLHLSKLMISKEKTYYVKYQVPRRFQDKIFVFGLGAWTLPTTSP